MRKYRFSDIEKECIAQEGEIGSNLIINVLETENHPAGILVCKAVHRIRQEGKPVPEKTFMRYGLEFADEGTFLTPRLEGY